MTRLALLEGVITPTMRVIASPDRRGLDQLRDLDTETAQPVIFAANHHSHVDTPLLLSSDASLPFWDAAPDLVPAAGVRDLVLQAARVTGAAVPR